jgi:hypothetical protein
LFVNQIYQEFLVQLEFVTADFFKNFLRAKSGIVVYVVLVSGFFKHLFTVLQVALGFPYILRV